MGDSPGPLPPGRVTHEGSGRPECTTGLRHILGLGMGEGSSSQFAHACDVSSRQVLICADLAFEAFLDGSFCSSWEDSTAAGEFSVVSGQREPGKRESIRTRCAAS